MVPVKHVTVTTTSTLTPLEIVTQTLENAYNVSTTLRASTVRNVKQVSMEMHSPRAVLVRFFTSIMASPCLNPSPASYV